jgi:hypothetical protein
VGGEVLGSMQGGAVREPRPCSPAEAVQRARRIANQGGQYILGSGSYHPKTLGGVLNDVPWTIGPGGLVGSDCAGFACWAYKLPRHRPGYNHGSWATVSDDLNTNSWIEDSEHERELFYPATSRPEPGDLLCYPTITLLGSDGEHHTFIGHVGIVVGVERATSWDSGHPRYDLLDVAQCRGPNGRAPGVILTDGSIWLAHDERWPKWEHRTKVLRAVP